MLNNKLLNKDKLLNQKKKYLFLIIIMLIGFISSIIFLLFIEKDDKILLNKEINNFFLNVKNNNLNLLSTFLNSSISNVLTIIIIGLIGVSIIGLPFILFFLFFKSFVCGFSIVSIIANYGFKGILLSLAYIFPHHLILLLIWLLLSYYAVSFSIKLVKYLIFKNNINLRLHFIKYLKICAICIIVSILCSLSETFITPYFIKLFIF